MVLITGANGLVGAAVARRFVAAGMPVRVLVRSQSRRDTLATIAHKIEWAEGDVLDILSLQAALEGVKYVVHCAAIVSFAPKDRTQMYKTNIEGTANVVNACLQASITKLCFLSSVAAIGRPDPKTIAPGQVVNLNENQKWEESPLNSHYAKTKYQAELEVWRGIAEGLPAVMVNPVVILGEGDWTRSSLQLFKYVFDEKPFYPEGHISYVDVADVAESIYQLCLSDIVAERYILSKGHIAYKDFLEKVARAFGKRPPRYRISRTLAQMLWPIEALRSFFTGNAPLLTKETAQTSAYIFEYENTKILNDLAHTNFTFSKLDQTIERCCKTFGQ